MSLTIIVMISLLAGALFRRALLYALRFAVWLILAIILLRFIASLDADPALLSPLILGIFGALLGGVLAYRFVYNALVNADRGRGHQRVDADADKRLI